MLRRLQRSASQPAGIENTPNATKAAVDSAIISAYGRWNTTSSPITTVGKINITKWSIAWARLRNAIVRRFAACDCGAAIGSWSTASSFIDSFIYSTRRGKSDLVGDALPSLPVVDRLKQLIIWRDLFGQIDCCLSQRGHAAQKRRQIPDREG